MNEMNLNVQPVTFVPFTFFEVKGLCLLILFPTIFQGFTGVLCGRERDAERIRVIHDCLMCKANGHRNCPFVREGVRYFMAHVREKYPSYSILQKRVVPNPRWKQFTKEETADLLKKVKGIEPITEHIGSSHEK